MKTEMTKQEMINFLSKDQSVKRILNVINQQDGVISTRHPHQIEIRTYYKDNHITNDTNNCDTVFLAQFPWASKPIYQIFSFQKDCGFTIKHLTKLVYATIVRARTDIIIENEKESLIFNWILDFLRE